MIPQRFIECWIIAEASSVSDDFQTIVVCTRPVWKKLAEYAKLPADKIMMAAKDGQCNVQLSDMKPAPIMVFKILNSQKEKMTVIAIEKTK